MTLVKEYGGVQGLPAAALRDDEAGGEPRRLPHTRRALTGNQTNPLLDNYEGMAITLGGPGLAGVSMISDDNFSPTQFTRVLNLIVTLP